MRQSLKVTVLLLTLVLLLASCNSVTGTNQNPTDGEQGSTTEPVTENPAKALVLIGADGKINCTVTKPVNASDATTEAVNKFINNVKKKTGVELPVVDEYSEIATRYEIAINATAGREPVAQQLAATPYTDYIIGMWDWHIMITTYSDASLSSALNAFVNSIESLDSGYCIRENISLQGSVILGNCETSVPLYETASGTVQPLYSVKNGYEVCIQNSNEAEFFSYAEKLEQNGFIKYSENNISAGSSVSGTNHSRVYTGTDIYVFLTWDLSQNTSRVVFTVPTVLPALTPPTLTSDDTANLSLTQLGIGGLGMSYVIQLKDYSFIVIDGGTNADANVSMLYDYLVSKTPAGQIPTVSAWIFTHPDPDHIGCPYAFLMNHMNDFNLQSVIANFPDCTIQSTSQDDSGIGSSIYTLESCISRFYAADYYVAHTGQKFYFKGLEMEVLYTEEDTYPSPVANYNETSLMAKFTFDNGKTFMMLADSTVKTSQFLAATYTDYLKSDILQLAHHGLIGGDKTLYQYIDPEYCLWATSQERFEGNYDTNKDGVINASDIQYCLGGGGCTCNKYIRDTTIRERTHYHAGQTFVIDIATA